jgi:hypothetical protein
MRLEEIFTAEELLLIDSGQYRPGRSVLDAKLDLATAIEREACAKVCEDASKPREGEMHSDAQWAGLVLAATIRARGNK